MANEEIMGFGSQERFGIGVLQIVLKSELFYCIVNDDLI